MPSIDANVNLFSGFNKDSLVLWDLKIPCMYIEWNSLGTTLVAITYENLTLISFEGKVLNVLQDINVHSVSWSKTNRLALTYQDKEKQEYYLAIYEPGKGITNKIPLTGAKGIATIKWGPDEERIIVYTGKEIIAVDLIDSVLTIEEKIELPLPGWLELSWSNNGTKFAVTGQWNVFLFTKNLEMCRKIYFGKLFPPQRLAWSPDDKYIAVGGREGHLCLLQMFLVISIALNRGFRMFLEQMLLKR